MGTYQTLTIGPYIQILGKLKKSVTKIKRKCPNHPKIKQPNAKFCRECATMIENFEYEEMEDINIYNILFEADVDEDDLNSPPFIRDILVSNEHVPGALNIEEGGGVTELKNIAETSAKQIIWFKERHNDAIVALENEFGPENIEVRYGLINDWS